MNFDFFINSHPFIGGPQRAELCTTADGPRLMERHYQIGGCEKAVAALSVARVCSAARQAQRQPACWRADTAKGEPPMLTTMRSGAAALLILLTASGVSAQSTDQSLREKLLGLAADPNLVPLVADQVGGFANLIRLEVSTAPTGVSGGGFRFGFDPATGTFVRLSDSFGPTFAERSLTSGKGIVTVGMNWLRSTYNSLGGLDLGNGELQHARSVENIPGATATLRMELSSTSVVSFATYGVSNNLDVGLLLPWTRVAMAASSVLSVGNNVLLAGSVPATSASGVGDIVLMGKYRVWTGRAGGLAGQVQLFLPSGDEDDLRGLGTTRTLLSAIWSRDGRFSPHANIGYEFWADDSAVSSSVAATGQFKYAVGADFVAHPRTTLVITMLGRRVLGGGSPSYQVNVVPGFGAIDALVPTDDSLNVLSIAPGVKWNAYSNLVVSGHLLASLVNDGIRANVTPMVGIDWTF